MLEPFATPKAWLDVGAGHAHFCATAREVWPDTVFDGLDWGDEIEEAARRGWIERAHRGMFPDLTDELDGVYDVVSMHHYLEHTRDPFAELDAAAKILPPGGHLLIELPDPEWPLARMFGKYWMPWFQPQHQHMMPIENLKRALADRGLVPIAQDRSPAHQHNDFVAARLSVLRRAGPRSEPAMGDETPQPGQEGGARPGLDRRRARAAGRAAPRPDRRTCRGQPPWTRQRLSGAGQEAGNSMNRDFADRPDLPPELRLVPYAYGAEYGHPPAGVWHSPGVVTLLRDGDATLSVAARWGAIVAAEPRQDGLVELAWMNRPAERLRLPVTEVVPGAGSARDAAALGPVWALREAGHPLGGVTLLVSVDLPVGSGVAAATATACAVAIALRDLFAPSVASAALAGIVAEGLRRFGVAEADEFGRCATALLGAAAQATLWRAGEVARFSFDSAAAGLRLMVVDTRVRTSRALRWLR